MPAKTAQPLDPQFPVPTACAKRLSLAVLEIERLAAAGLPLLDQATRFRTAYPDLSAVECSEAYAEATRRGEARIAALATEALLGADFLYQA